jgi:hypothetical protein
MIIGVLPSHAFKARYGLLCVAVPFTFASNPLLLSWLTGNLRDTTAATLGIALNISVGQASQIIGKLSYSSSNVTSNYHLQVYLHTSLLKPQGIRLVISQMPAFSL